MSEVTPVSSTPTYPTPLSNTTNSEPTMVPPIPITSITITPTYSEPHIIPPSSTKQKHTPSNSPSSSPRNSAKTKLTTSTNNPSSTTPPSSPRSSGKTKLDTSAHNPSSTTPPSSPRSSGKTKLSTSGGSSKLTSSMPSSTIFLSNSDYHQTSPGSPRSLASTTSISVSQLPPTPVEKSQVCPNCEQPFHFETELCPHCRRSPQIELEVVVVHFPQVKAELETKLLAHPEDEQIKSELVQLLFSQGMKLRYDDPSTALKCFRETLLYDKNYTEAALKTSWLCIKSGTYDEAMDVLIPVVENTHTTILQKQRAYTNLACCDIWNPNPKYESAASYARAGIALDGKGTNKLWENLGSALKHQNHLDEAFVAYSRAIEMNPKSSNANERRASVERHLKIERKKRKKEEGKKNKSKSRSSSPQRTDANNDNNYGKF